jgi:hypothetical protein
MGSDFAAESAATRNRDTMRTLGKRGIADRPAGRLLGHDGWRALIACLCLTPLLALGAHLSSDSLSSIFSKRTVQREAADGLKTGSILFVPQYGDKCRRLLIDNTTWFIADYGFIDCKIALAQARARIGQQPSVRLEGIRSGFRKK